MTDFRKISEDARKEREGEKERQADIDDRSFTAAQTLAEGIVDRLVKQFASSQDWNYEVDSRTTTQKVVIKCAGVDADDDDVELDVCIRPTEGRLLCKVSLALLDDDGTDNRWLHNGQEGSFPMDVEQSDFGSWLESELGKCAAECGKKRAAE